MLDKGIFSRAVKDPAEGCRWIALSLFLLHFLLPTLVTWSGESMFGYEIIYEILLIAGSNEQGVGYQIPLGSALRCLFTFLALIYLFHGLLFVTGPFHSRLIQTQSRKRDLFNFLVVVMIFVGPVTGLVVGNGVALIGYYVWLVANIFLLIGAYISYSEGRADL
jgi:hypothetical protein